MGTVAFPWFPFPSYSGNVPPGVNRSRFFSQPKQQTRFFLPRGMSDDAGRKAWRANMAPRATLLLVTIWWTRLWFSEWTKTSWSSWTSITPGFSNKDLQLWYCHLCLWQSARWCQDGLRRDEWIYTCIHVFMTYYIYMTYMYMYTYMCTYIHTFIYIFTCSMNLHA